MAAKTTAKKTAAVQTAEPKRMEIKETEKKAAEVVAEKAAEVKKAVKKAAPKKTAVKKEIKVSTYVEFGGKQVDEKTMIADIKKSWTKSGNKVRDIKTMDLYIKPEENAVYYVINGNETGSVAF